MDLNILVTTIKTPAVIASLMLLVVTLIILYRIIRNNHRKEGTKISFKEAMELTELPVVTFYNNKQKLNFLLDTGSNDSHIDKGILNTLDYIPLGMSRPVITVGMQPIHAECCDMVISNKNQNFSSRFNITDLHDAFKAIKNESGVQMHGILGSTFFQSYKYVLDFDELIAYLK